MNIRVLICRFVVPIAVVIFLASCSQENEAQTFYSTGELHIQASLKNSVVDGLSVTYFKNGNKKSEAYYKAGILDGLAISYYKSLQKKTQAKYKRGLLNGVSIS